MLLSAHVRWENDAQYFPSTAMWKPSRSIWTATLMETLNMSGHLVSMYFSCLEYTGDKKPSTKQEMGSRDGGCPYMSMAGDVVCSTPWLCDHAPLLLFLDMFGGRAADDCCPSG